MPLPDLLTLLSGRVHLDIVATYSVLRDLDYVHIIPLWSNLPLVGARVINSFSWLGLGGEVVRLYLEQVVVSWEEGREGEVRNTEMRGGLQIFSCSFTYQTTHWSRATPESWCQLSPAGYEWVPMASQSPGTKDHCSTPGKGQIM